MDFGDSVEVRRIRIEYKNSQRLTVAVSPISQIYSQSIRSEVIPRVHSMENLYGTGRSAKGTFIDGVQTL